MDLQESPPRLVLLCNCNNVIYSVRVKIQNPHTSLGFICIFKNIHFFVFDNYFFGPSGWKFTKKLIFVTGLWISWYLNYSEKLQQRMLKWGAHVFREVCILFICLRHLYRLTAAVLKSKLHLKEKLFFFTLAQLVQSYHLMAAAWDKPNLQCVRPSAPHIHLVVVGGQVIDTLALLRNSALQ